MAGPPTAAKPFLRNQRRKSLRSAGLGISAGLSYDKDFPQRERALPDGRLLNHEQSIMTRAAKSRPRALAFVRRLAYTGSIGIPACLVASGCGSGPAPPPPEAASADVDDIKARMEGIEYGTESGPPTDSRGGESDSSKTEDQHGETQQ